MWYAIAMAHDWIVSRSFAPLRSVALVMLVLLATACPGGDASDDASEGTSTGVDTGDADVSADTADGDSGDPASTCESQTVAIDTLAAVLLVKVEILNDTVEPVYLVGSAMECTEYALERSGSSVPIASIPRCGCECAEYPPASVEVVAVEPGDSFVVYWDGRVQLDYRKYFFCEEDASCWDESTSAAQPLEPGPITMTIPLYDEAGSFELSPGPLSICESPRSFDVSFELGTEDLTVPVALSEVLAP